MSNIIEGTRVKYTANFLRSIGAQTGDLAFARGVVTKISKLGSSDIASLQWDRDKVYPASVNVLNLEKCNLGTRLSID